MTEWNGIKVGSLYKRTGRGSRRSPLVLVTAIDKRPPYGAAVTVLVGCEVETIKLRFDSYEDDCVQMAEYRSSGMGSRSKDIVEYEEYVPWPYKEVLT